jgi:hypothetical protein
MLCVNNYKKDYIDECRSSMEAQLTAYQTLLTTARAKAGTGNAALTQPLRLLNRCSSTTWSWFWTASSFIEAGQSKERMAIF